MSASVGVRTRWKRGRLVGVARVNTPSKTSAWNAHSGSRHRGARQWRSFASATGEPREPIVASIAKCACLRKIDRWHHSCAEVDSVAGSLHRLRRGGPSCGHTEVSIPGLNRTC